jgi:hypothetical protein
MTHLLIHNLSTDITLELLNRDDRFPTDVSHLMLGFSAYGGVGATIDLFSCESIPGIWNTEKALCV